MRTNQTTQSLHGEQCLAKPLKGRVSGWALALWWAAAVASSTAQAAAADRLAATPPRLPQTYATEVLLQHVAWRTGQAKTQAKGNSRSSAKNPNKNNRPSTATGPLLGTSPEVQAFAAEVVQRHGLPQAWVLSQLGQARRLQAVRALMAPPPSTAAPRSWANYRAGFLQAPRVAAGVAFWRDNARALERAQRQYGVPAQVVVGIMGVETFYGQLTGNFRAMDALATLAFDYPTGGNDRSAFFRSELEALLVLSHQERRSPFGFKGSHAGATGLAQFLPSSIQKYAVDFNGDGRIDLQGSATDAVGSVASYLAQFGWQRDMPTHFETTPPSTAEDLAALLAKDILPTISVDQWQQRGASLPQAAHGHPGLLALVELPQGGAAPSYVAGTQNFYAITRYNRSSFYAMAVIELGQAVAAQRQGPDSAR